MIKLGIVGGGVNSAVGAAHVAAMRMTGKFELVAGMFSRTPEINIDSAEKYGCEMTAIPEVLLDLFNIDRVVIVTPTINHFDHVAMCTGAKLPVLCEKALGTNATETANIVVRVNKLNTPLSIVFNYAFYPAVQKLRELILDGEIGTITHIHAEMPQSGYLVAKPQDWRLSDMGIYLDLGTHLHHLIWFLSGASPVAVQAVERRLSDIGVVDYVSSLVRYPDFDAHLWFSKCSAGHTNGLRIRVYGTNGSAEWYQREPDVLRLASAEMTNAPILMEVQNPRFKLGHPTGFVEALANVYDAWADNPSHPDLSPSVAHDGLVLMEAMRRAAMEEKEVIL